jgi:hypothetical protein
MRNLVNDRGNGRWTVSPMGTEHASGVSMAKPLGKKLGWSEEKLDIPVLSILDLGIIYS